MNLLRIVGIVAAFAALALVINRRLRPTAISGGECQLPASIEKELDDMAHKLNLKKDVFDVVAVIEGGKESVNGAQVADVLSRYGDLMLVLSRRSPALAKEVEARLIAHAADREREYPERAREIAKLLDNRAVFAPRPGRPARS